MALDFPSNPVNGQVFDAYVWSASKGVWQAREEQAPITITSPTVPSTAQNGDLWFNTTNGLVFTYYDDGSSAQWVEVLSSAVPSVNEIMPVGTITQTARISSPSGWLLCEGQAVSRTEYVRLFDAIGTLYGSGDGTTTFNVPNLKGRIPVGKDSAQTEFDALGETGGAKTHTLTEAQLPGHTHTFSGTTSGESGHTHNINGLRINDSGSGVQMVAQSDGNIVIYSGGAAQGFGQRPLTSNAREWSIGAASDSETTTGSTGHTHTYSGTTSTGSGSGSAHNNIQPYIVLNYMIKV